MFTTPAGSPASIRRRPSHKAVSDVSSAGLSITVHPHARAGASFIAAISSGEFHGVIAPTTPIGSRTVYAMMRFAGGCMVMELGIVVPPILFAKPV